MNKTVSLLAVGFLAGIVAAAAVFAWLGQRARATTPGGVDRVLRVAHALPTSHPVHRGIEMMARRAGELSGGRLRLEVFPGEQLGNEVQCLEQVQAGTLAITKVSAAAVGNFVSTYKVFGLPYLFRDDPHFWRVLDSSTGTELLQIIAVGNDGRPSGLTGLCFYDAGSRNFYSKVPILTPQDLRGKKIRVMNDPVAMEMIQAMGGAATPIPWGELYTALQQGVVDAAENNPPSLLSSRHYEVCKFFTLNHHTRIPDVLVISSRVWNRLSPQEQEWIKQAAEESSEFQRRLWAEESDKAIQELKRAGVDVREVDPEPFRAASRSVLDKYSEGKILELVHRIQAVR
jgi:tripartite ATP-independent transporter DctP family solute receptor